MKKLLIYVIMYILDMTMELKLHDITRCQKEWEMVKLNNIKTADADILTFKQEDLTRGMNFD